MNVGDLREIIKDLPDNVLVLRPGDDHSFCHAKAFVDKVIFEDGGDHISEFYQSTPIGPNDFIDNALVIE